MSRLRALYVATILLVFTGPSVEAFAGSLTGDVFVTMQSGDVRRAADVDVVIVPATPEFESEWERLQSEYEERVKPVVAEYESLKAQQESLRLSGDAASRSGNHRAALNYSQQSMALSDQMFRIGRERWGPLQREYTVKATQLVTQRAAARVPTDVNGHFEANVPAGRYYVFSRYQLPREVLYWLVPAQVQDDAPSKVSLSNRTGTRSPLRGRTYTSY